MLGCGASAGPRTLAPGEGRSAGTPKPLESVAKTPAAWVHAIDILHAKRTRQPTGPRFYLKTRNPSRTKLFFTRPPCGD